LILISGVFGYNYVKSKAAKGKPGLPTHKLKKGRSKKGGKKILIRV
jgi:hypothetical protein